MYTPKYFSYFELVPKYTYDNYHQGILKGLMDERVLITADALRSRYGPATVNDWNFGGKNQYRGWRPMGCDVGATLSQHKFGRALDMTFENIKAEEVRQDILDNPGSFPLITCVEGNVSWLHFDVRNCQRIKVFNP